MFYRTFADDGDNPMNNPNIYNVERGNRLSLALQQVLDWSTTLDNRKCVGNPGLLSVRFRNGIFYAEIILLASAKQNIIE
jgi:hypothetical protein